MPKSNISIHFITGNPGKFKEAKAIIPELSQLDLDLPEIQELDPQKIIQAKLETVYDHHTGAFVVEDVCLSFSCLQGLPGPLTKWFEIGMGLEAMADLVHRYDDHRVTASTIVGFSPQQREIHYFTGEIHGTVVKPRGKGGFGFDTIFQPEGYEVTLAEMPADEKRTISHRGQAFRKLKEFLERV